jgi:hypothetical protein
MASKTKVTPQKEGAPEKEGADTLPDCPLLDLSDAEVKKLIRNAKKRGYVTVDQINSVLPSEEAWAWTTEANRPALTHGRPYSGFGWFPLQDTGEHAKRVSESRRANAAYVGKTLAVPPR